MVSPELKGGGKCFRVHAGERGNAREYFVGGGGSSPNAIKACRRRENTLDDDFAAARNSFSFCPLSKKCWRSLSRSVRRSCSAAMEIHWHDDAGHNISTIENTATLLYVEQLDGKTSADWRIFGGEKQRGRFVLVPAPPVHDGATRVNSRVATERKTHKTFKSEWPSLKSPRAAEP
jgi:hypothetical protein